MPVLPGKDDTNGVDEVDGVISEPPTPIAEQPDSIPVSPTSPTHPNFYKPPKEVLSDDADVKDEPEKSPSQTSVSSITPINLVLRLR